MKTSLVSREVIADSIEIVGRGHLFDADRGPQRLRQDDPRHGDGAGAPGRAQRDAVRRVDRAGPLRRARRDHPGRLRGGRRPRRGDDQRGGAGGAGGRGLARAPGPAAGSTPPTRWRWPTRCWASRRWDPRWSRPSTPGRPTSPHDAGRLVMDVLARGQRPSEIITRPALENAIAAIATSGGSTNGVLHLLALAREVGVELTIDDFDEISRAHAAAVRPQARRAVRRRRPVPGRRGAAGGPPAARRRPAARGRLHRDRHVGGRPRPRGRRVRRASRSCGRCRTRSRPRAAW